MNMKTIQDLVISIVAEQLGMLPTEVTLESTRTTLGMDSLDELELEMAIEDEFDVTFLPEDVQKLVTLQDIVDYVTPQNPTEDTNHGW